MDTLTRANARELAVHLIYGRDFTGEEPEQVVSTRLDKEYYEKAVENSKRGNEFYSKEHVTQMWDEFYTKVRDSIGK